MRNRLRPIGLVLLMFGVLTFAIACGEEAAPAPVKPPGVVATPIPAPTMTPTPVGLQPKFGGILINSIRRDTPSDPMMSGDTTLGHAGGPMFGNGHLTKPCRGDTYNICAGLAESWKPSSDFTQWTFTLRDNIYWHDGTKFTAADAKFWVDLSVNGAKQGDKARKASRFAAQFGDPISSEALSDTELRVSFANPFPALLASWTAPDNAIAHPRHLMQPEIDKGNPLVSPEEVGWIGTGPFKFEKFDKGSVLQVRKFDKYWEKDTAGRQLPFLDGVDMPVIRDPAAMDAAFRSGRIDATGRGAGPHLSPERKARYRTSPVGDSTNFHYIDYLSWDLAINTRVEPWDDIRVRRAVSLWIDRDAGILAADGGHGRLSTFWGPSAPWVNPDFREWPGWNASTKEADRAEAKRLLAEAGYPDGFDVSIQCWTFWVPQCEFLDAQLSELFGTRDKTTQELIDPATWFANLCKEDGFIFQLNSNTSILPQQAINELSPKAACGDIKADDTKIDEYFDKLKATNDPKEWVTLGRELEKYIVQEKVYYIPLWYLVAVLATRDYVVGMPIPTQNVTPDTDHALVWLNK